MILGKIKKPLNEGHILFVIILQKLQILGKRIRKNRSRYKYRWFRI